MKRTAHLSLPLPRSRGFTPWLVAVGLLVPAATSTPHAFQLIQPWRRWFPQDLPRIIYVDPRGRPAVNDPDEGVTSTMIGIERWEEAAGVGDLIKPVLGSPSDPTAVPPYSGADGFSVLRWDDPAVICRGSCLAATTTGGVDFGQSGQCGGRDWNRWTDADICFNPGGGIAYTSEAEVAGGDPCIGEYYLEGVALHEVGHLLALGHSGKGEAVMYAFAGTCETWKLHPVTDDVNGIRTPYACGFSQGGTFADSDGDGYRQDVDCDDQDAATHPGAAEACDLADNDCDGTGDAAEGLACATACLDASAGVDGLVVRKGACTTHNPGRRYVYARGTLSNMQAAAGVMSVSMVDCPLFTIYDRVSESSLVPGGAPGWYYLVRNSTDTGYGVASNGTPRTPVEGGCP